MVETVRGRLKDNDGDFAARQVLLVSQVCVHRNQHIKSSFRDTQKFAVLFSGPTRFLHGAAFVPRVREDSLECFRGALIQQRSHLSWATRLSLASSIAAMASSRVTLGYCSRN